MNVLIKKEEAFEIFKKFFDEAPSFMKINDTYSTTIENGDEIYIFNFLKKEENITQVSVNAILRDTIKCCGFNISMTKKCELA